MSVEAIEWAITQRVGCTVAKHLLLVLASYHNGKTGLCFPSIETIANATEMSERTVYRKLLRLGTLGLVTVQSTRNSSNRYVLHMNRDTTRQMQVESLPADAPQPDSQSPQPDTQTGPTCHSVTLTGNNRKEPSPSVSSPKRARAKATSLMTEDWQPDPAVRDKMAAEYPRLELDHETDQFRDYWLARGDGKADWNAAYRNWIRRSAQSTSRPSQLRAPFPTRAERIAGNNRERLDAFLSHGDPLEAERSRPLAVGYYRSG